MTDPDPRAIELAHRLFDAARNGDAETIEAYVSAGVPVDMLDAQGNSMLMLAAYHGNVDVVRVLVEADADLDLLNDRGQSPIAGAVFKDETEIVGILRDAGADLDAGTPSARATAQMFDRMHLLD